MFPILIIVGILDEGVPQVLINREPLKHLTFDVELLGDCDVVIAELCRRLGSDWLEGIGQNPSHKSAGHYQHYTVLCNIIILISYGCVHVQVLLEQLLSCGRGTLINIISSYTPTWLSILACY